MKARALQIAIGAVALSLTSAAQGYAQRPSALVLEAEGPSTPRLELYSEIPAGTTVSLGGGSKIVFLHYFTCRTVSVVGGKLTVETEGYSLVGGATSEQRTPCPPKINLKRAGEPAGLMVRGIKPPPSQAGPAPGAVRLSTQPSFVLVGARADDVAAVRVSQGTSTLLEAPLANRAFRWPSGTVPLAPDAEYELTLLPKDATATTRSLKFTTEPASPGAPAGLSVLITVE